MVVWRLVALVAIDEGSVLSTLTCPDLVSDAALGVFGSRSTALPVFLGSRFRAPSPWDAQWWQSRPRMERMEGMST